MLTIDQIAAPISQADIGNFAIGVLLIIVAADTFRAIPLFRIAVLIAIFGGLLIAAADRELANQGLGLWQRLYASGLVPGLTLGLPLRAVYRRALQPSGRG